MYYMFSLTHVYYCPACLYVVAMPAFSILNQAWASCPPSVVLYSLLSLKSQVEFAETATQQQNRQRRQTPLSGTAWLAPVEQDKACYAWKGKKVTVREGIYTITE